jgi:ribosomal-protein-alanine N-acetyltransferase
MFNEVTMSAQFAKSLDDLFEDRIVIETDRLILNKISMDDQMDIWELFGDEQVTTFTDFSTRVNYEDSKKVLDYFISCYEQREQYRFAIRLKETNEMIGTFGLFAFDDTSDLAEIGYELKRKYWKKGYMTECLGGIVETFFLKMNGHRLEAIITPENIDSEKMLVRCGFVREGMYRARDFIKGRYLDGVIYGVLKDDLFRDVH